jgi:hypothetical protein
MENETDKSRLELVAELLTSHGVRFIVIGGQAEILLGGSPEVLSFGLESMLQVDHSPRTICQTRSPTAARAANT